MNSERWADVAKSTSKATRASRSGKGHWCTCEVVRAGEIEFKGVRAVHSVCRKPILRR